MSPLEKLHAHHEELIGTIKSLADRARKTPSDVSLLLSYCHEYLIPHAEGEEATFYAACDDADFVKNLVHEHRELKQRLNVIDVAFSRGDLQAIISGIDNFMDLLGKHFEDEENTLIPRLSAKLSQEEIESLIQEAHSIETGKRISDVRALLEYDHRRIELNISALQGAKDNEATAKSIYSKIRAQLIRHIELEEKLLFPAFINHPASDQVGPIHAVITEHREITSYISIPVDQLDMSMLSNNLQKLSVILAVHHRKEETVVYPLINSTLHREKREKVYKDCFEKLTKA